MYRSKQAQDVGISGILLIYGTLFATLFYLELEETIIWVSLGYKFNETLPFSISMMGYVTVTFIAIGLWQFIQEKT